MEDFKDMEMELNMELNEKLNEMLNEESNEEPKDYRDEEDLLCCGKCHTRKECIVMWPLMDGTDRKVPRAMPIACKCQQERMNKEAAEREEREHRDTVARLKGICFKSPSRYEQTFDKADMIEPKNLELARQFVDDWETVKKKKGGLLFWGDVGTGKSFTAACIANALMEQEVKVLMCNIGDFMDSSFGDREELYKDLTRYDLIIFDDFGMERSTDYGLEIVFRVIDTRCESGKPTIITTNLSLKELQNPREREHKRIYDRVLQMCPTPVSFGGESKRKLIHQTKKSIFHQIFLGGRE